MAGPDDEATAALYEVDAAERSWVAAGRGEGSESLYYCAAQYAWHAILDRDV